MHLDYVVSYCECVRGLYCECVRGYIVVSYWTVLEGTSTAYLTRKGGGGGGRSLKSLCYPNFGLKKIKVPGPRDLKDLKNVFFSV